MNGNGATTIVPAGIIKNGAIDTSEVVDPCDNDAQLSNKKRPRPDSGIPTETSSIDVDKDLKVGHENDGIELPHQDQHQPPPLYQPNKKTKKKHMDPKILQFRTLIQKCCKNNDLHTAIVAYGDAIPNQIRIEAQTFYNLLHLCSNDNNSVDTRENVNELGDHVTATTVFTNAMKIHVGTPKASTPSLTSQRADPITVVTIEERRIFAERVKCHMDQLQIPLTENAYTALVRVYCCCRNDVADDSSDDNTLEIAEGILTEAENQQQCKVRLRLYTPLLQKYCELGLLRSAIQIWHRISKQDITLTELEYCSLLHCCNKMGSCEATIAAVVFERVLTDLAEDILIPSHATRHAIIQWFQSKHAVVYSNGEYENGNNDGSTQDSDAIKGLLQQIRVPYEHSNTVTMGPVQRTVSATQNTTGWAICDQCAIDTKTGTLLSGCLNGAKLQPISISSYTWDLMKQMNENIAITNKISDTDTTNYQGGGKGRKVILDERTIQQRRNHWNHFHSFLSQYGSGMDVLIDGANVGYYEQNFNGAPRHVDYHQINWMVQYLMLTLKKKVLLIMHSRHFALNLMPKYAQPIVQGWIKENILYQTPPGMNDDWFWLHAALHFGPGTRIVTNDEMRDHHFQMIAPRSFIRWRDRHQIHFNFGHWMPEPNESRSDGNSKAREVNLQYPDPYSRRIQRVLDGLVIPLPKRGDTNRFMDGVFVADDEEPHEEMYLCIRPSTSTNS
jgi:Protein-only RNase P/Pentacotripeptide-repeat region of PRORP